MIDVPTCVKKNKNVDIRFNATSEWKIKICIY